MKTINYLILAISLFAVNIRAEEPSAIITKSDVVKAYTNIKNSVVDTIQGDHRTSGTR